LSVFGADYVSYYDLFYADKDYGAEAAFTVDVIKRHRPMATSLLELGCGSARHAVEFAQSGFSVAGIDRSADMIARGRERIARLPADLRDRIALIQGDATNYRADAVHDAVISLFHVMSYQTTNDALHRTFRTARSATTPGGLFVFDFWYGPAVLTDRPEVRVRRVANADVEVVRIAEPDHDVNRNIVDVKYTFLAIDKKTGRGDERTEVHPMRYLFLPEIELLAAGAGFEIVESGEWLSGRELGARCWSGYVAARARAD